MLFEVQARGGQAPFPDAGHPGGGNSSTISNKCSIHSPDECSLESLAGGQLAAAGAVAGTGSGRESRS